MKVVPCEVFGHSDKLAIDIVDGCQSMKWMCEWIRLISATILLGEAKTAECRTLLGVHDRFVAISTRGVEIVCWKSDDYAMGNQKHFLDCFLERP